MFYLVNFFFETRNYQKISLPEMSSLFPLSNIMVEVDYGSLAVHWVEHEN